MARFTADVPLKIRWNGLEFEGASGSTYRLPDEYYDEFVADVTPRIQGNVTWIITDETLSVPLAQTDVTGLTAALAGKYPVTGGTISGAVTVTGAVAMSATLDVGGAATFGSSILAQEVGGVVYADRYSSLAAALTAGAGGIVEMPEGSYALSSSVFPASNTRLRGRGVGTVITMSGNLPVIQLAASASGVVVENMRIIGSATSASTTAFGVYAVNGCSNITFQNLLIESCWRAVGISASTSVLVRNVRVVSDKSTAGGAIDANASYYVRVESCIVESPTLHGVDFREGGGYNTAVDCSVISAGSTGFVISGSGNTGLSIPGCSFINCKSIVAGVTLSTGCGFIVENGALFASVVGCLSSAAAANGFLVGKGTGDRPSGVTFSGCIARSPGLYGFYDFDSNLVMFTGCEVTNGANDGFRVNTTQEVTGAAVLTGCIVNGATATSSAGIRITGTAEGVSVNGCAVRSVNGYGIYVDAPRTTLTGTTVMDADNTGVLTIGGITLTTNADRSIVTGCVSRRSSGTKQDYGVDVESGCTNAIVTSNVLYQNTTGTLLDNGTTTTNANNVTT